MLTAASKTVMAGRLQTMSRLGLGVVVFLAGWLLFTIEPLTGKIITPMLGGASEVWVVCLLFFQLVVLGGYLLTYCLSRLSKQRQLLVYVTLFAISLFWARIPYGAQWTFTRTMDPTWALLGELTVHLSAPCIILASISGTMQLWNVASGSSSPYGLYGVSNLGALVALLAYPTVVEPALPVSTTVQIWEPCYYLLFALALVCSVMIWRQVKLAEATEATDSAASVPDSPTRAQFVHWLFLSGLGSAGLMAFTSHITTDIAPVPLLWVVPLAIYLLTFAVAFSRSQVRTDLLLKFWIPMVIAEPIAMNFSPAVVLSINLILLYQLCMVTNAELSGAKPEAANLSNFYLAIAAGGAIGGMLVALAAPMCFKFVGERGVVILVFTIYHLFRGAGSLSKRRLNLRIALASALALVLVGWLVLPTPDIIYRARNFFGSVAVKREGDMVKLFHGRICHGAQYSDPAKATIDVYPYGPPASLVLAFVHDMHPGDPIDLGVIGLGTGSMAMETRHGDSISFYEIDPKIVAIAHDRFTYLDHSPARVSIETGDGRLLLQESKRSFNALCVDAFSGDAIPVHLLTSEAMKIYLEHLKSDGILLFHLTNAYLDLPPIVGNLAEALQLSGCELIDKNNTKYVALARNPSIIRDLTAFAIKRGSEFSDTRSVPLPVRSDLRVWTDDYSNLFSVLKWR